MSLTGFNLRRRQQAKAKALASVKADAPLVKAQEVEEVKEVVKSTDSEVKNTTVKSTTVKKSTTRKVVEK